MNPSSRIRSRPRSTSALAYSLSHLVFGVTSLAHGLLSYVDGDAVAAAFFTLGGVGIVAFVAYETVDSGSSETPEE